MIELLHFAQANLACFAALREGRHTQDHIDPTTTGGIINSQATRIRKAFSLREDVNNIIRQGTDLVALRTLVRSIVTSSSDVVTLTASVI